MIERLQSSPDDAARWIDTLRGADGVADLSSLEWRTSAIVLNELRLEKIRIRGVTILPDIVWSEIRECEFGRVSTDAGFWGGGNDWTRCEFGDCRLNDCISPQNRFRDCRFHKCAIVGYHPCETLFQRCEFVSCHFVNLMAIPRRGWKWDVAEMEKIGTSLQFIECSFGSTTFTNCAFGDVAFRQCTFQDPVVTSCNFQGVDSDVHWWGDAPDADLFVAFLDEAIREIKRKVSPDAKSAEALARFRKEYVEANSKNKDYSECLDSDEIAYEEAIRVNEVLNAIEPRYEAAFRD